MPTMLGFICLKNLFGLFNICYRKIKSILLWRHREKLTYWCDALKACKWVFCDSVQCMSPVEYLKAEGEGWQLHPSLKGHLLVIKLLPSTIVHT